MSNDETAKERAAQADLKKQQSKARAERFSTILSFIVATASLIGVIASALFGFGLENAPPSRSDLSDMVADQRQIIDFLQARVQVLDRSIAAIVASQSDSAGLGSLPLAPAELSSMSQRLSAMEDVILDNPNKAMSMVLMREDITDLQEQSLTNLTLVQQDINRVYDLTKWLIGLLFTLALGLLSLAVGNLFKNKSSTDAA